MVKFYYNMVVMKKITIEEVPTKYREEVRALLE